MSLLDLDYYTALEVAPGVDYGELVEAYNRVVDNYREDSLASYGLLSDEERRATVEYLEEALRVLSDDDKREAYNRKLVDEGIYSARELQFQRRQPDVAPPPERAPEPEPLSDAISTPAPSVFQPPQDESPFRPTLAEPPRLEESSSFAEPAAEAVKPRNLLDVIGERPIGGPELKEMREAAGATLEDVTAVTKVSLSNLRFIEAMNLEFLPAPVYLKGSLRVYAKFLRIDPERVVRDYMQIYESRKGG